MTCMQNQSVTDYLHAWNDGEEGASDVVAKLVYEDLQRIAHNRVHREGEAHTTTRPASRTRRG